jgi:hypothetical protein
LVLIFEVSWTLWFWIILSLLPSKKSLFVFFDSLVVRYIYVQSIFFVELRLKHFGVFKSAFTFSSYQFIYLFALVNWKLLVTLTNWALVVFLVFFLDCVQRQQLFVISRILRLICIFYFLNILFHSALWLNHSVLIIGVTEIFISLINDLSMQTFSIILGILIINFISKFDIIIQLIFVALFNVISG